MPGGQGGTVSLLRDLRGMPRWCPEFKRHMEGFRVKVELRCGI